MYYRIKKITSTKLDKKIIFSFAFPAIVFFMIYYCIRFCYPYFFPYYQNSAFLISTDTTRVYFGVFSVVCAFLFVVYEQLIFRHDNSVSLAVVLILQYCYFVPGLYMNMMYKNDFRYCIIYFLFYFMFNVLFFLLPKLKKTQTGLNFSESKKICLIICFACLVFSLSLNRFRINIFNVLDSSSVYETRWETDYTATNSILWYFLIFCANIIPTWLAISIHQKKKFLSVFLIFLSMSLYSISNNRQFLFFTAISLLCSLFKKKDKLLVLFVLFVWLAPIVEFACGTTNPMISNILRRMILTPNVDSSYHVDFFMTHEPDFLRQTWQLYFNRIGLRSLYPQKIASLLGYEYLNSKINLNTGLVGGSFANYGYASLLISPCLYVIAVRFFDKLSKKTNNVSIIFSTAFVIAFSLTNSESFLESVLVPSWILLYFLAFYFLPIHYKKGTMK